MGALPKLSSKGQLTIPKEVREKLDLVPGTEFHITADAGRVLATPSPVLKPKKRSIMEFAGILGKPPQGQGFTDADINGVVMDAAVEDDERIRREWRKDRK
jgi:AbrB family looped-hinge helix DNA binding protein